jgi:hypothetical protein
MEPPGDFINCPERSKISGTREWAVAEINCCLGCPHGCRYCYARYDQVERRRLVAAEQWRLCRILPAEVDRLHPLYPGQVMFPAAHDIIPENLEACCIVLGNLLAAGNRVLVVSKPQAECIEALCQRFSYARDHILFRFTITARDKVLLNFWEPYTPDYEERLRCLVMARDRGFSTSVSVEPILDSADVVAMVHELLPLVSHSIWLGKMNKIDERVVIESPQVAAAVAMIEAGQSDARLRQIHQQLAGIPIIHWKESIKQVLGLPLSIEAGLDL